MLIKKRLKHPFTFSYEYEIEPFSYRYKEVTQTATHIEVVLTDWDSRVLTWNFVDDNDVCCRMKHIPRNIKNNLGYYMQTE